MGGTEENRRIALSSSFHECVLPLSHDWPMPIQQAQATTHGW